MGQHSLVCIQGIQWLDDEYEIYFTSETGFFIHVFNFHDCEHLGIFNRYIINKLNKLTSNKIIKSYINETFVTQFANEIFGAHKTTQFPCTHYNITHKP